MFSRVQPILPKGSTILVVGANGFIGSNISNELLKLGYKVRGTTRNLEKNEWLRELFDSKYGPGKFEMALVADCEAEGALDEVMKGMCEL